MVNRYNPDFHHRRSIRLKGYDYSKAGAYFITICVHNRECLFGEIGKANNQMPGECQLGECHSPLPEMGMNEFGRIVQDEWLKTPGIRPEIKLGGYVVMPNHFHGIVIITNQSSGACGGGVGAYGHTPLRGHTPLQGNSPIHTLMRSPSRTIGAMVRSFKSAVTKRINEIRKSTGNPVWQRNYHEHVIRDEVDYTRIAEYIATNIQRWCKDKLHPDNFGVPANISNATAIAHDDGVEAYGNTPGIGVNDVGGDNVVGANSNGNNESYVVGAYGNTPKGNMPKCNTSMEGQCTRVENE